MDITLKLYATLSNWLPAGADQNQVALTIPDGSTVLDVLTTHQVPQESCHLILINGNYTPLAAADQKILQNGDVLAVWPPVAGG